MVKTEDVWNEIGVERECIHFCSSFTKHNIQCLKALMWQHPLLPLKKARKVAHVQICNLLKRHYEAFIAPVTEQKIVS